MLVEFEENRVLPFDHLSDGQRTMLGLFCDIARRAALLNPHLGGNACDQTTGVVLIDELDLHLHPLWQRQVIDGLLKLFPKIQFICTTHSPFVIQALQEGKLIMIDEEKAADFANMSIEDIAEVIQGIENPQRSKRHQDMLKAAEAYFTLLRRELPQSQKEITKLKDELNRLSAPFSNDAAYQAWLNIERLSVLGDRNL